MNRSNGSTILAAVGFLLVMFAGWFLYCALSIVLGAGIGGVR
jgi:hypothetical protein